MQSPEVCHHVRPFGDEASSHDGVFFRKMRNAQCSDAAAQHLEHCCVGERERVAIVKRGRLVAHCIIDFFVNLTMKKKIKTLCFFTMFFSQQRLPFDETSCRSLKESTTKEKMERQSIKHYDVRAWQHGQD